MDDVTIELAIPKIGPQGIPTETIKCVLGAWRAPYGPMLA